MAVLVSAAVCIMVGLVMVSDELASGYLPAEHIETPTERLARLNKHRNIDVRMNAELGPLMWRH